MTARVQNSGLARVTALLIAAAWYFQWGTGTGAAATANAVTTTGTAEARVAATATQQTTTATSDTMRLVGTLTATGTRALTEIGAFDAAGAGSPPTGGNMDIYCDFAVINLSPGDGIQFTINTSFV